MVAIPIRQSHHLLLSSIWQGLHSEVIQTIHATEQIKRLVYVGSNPTGSIVNDAALLCTPQSKRYVGTRYRI
jgi:hypothetical protein